MSPVISNNCRHARAALLKRMLTSLATLIVQKQLHVHADSAGCNNLLSCIVIGVVNRIHVHLTVK